jgi:hypothetical protein
MNERIDPLSCAAFQAQLPDLIGSGESPSDHPHLQTCANCRSLLADLETIAAAARQLFPVVEPPDDLWTQIESAMKFEDGDVRRSAGPGNPEHRVQG